MLEGQLGENVLLGPWLRFASSVNSKLTFCQPDAVYVDRDLLRCTVFEIKLKHTSDAWWQVRQLYIPVLRAILPPSFTFHAVELVKWYDPHTAFPEKFRYLESIDQKHLAQLGEDFNLHIWSGKAGR